MGTWSVSEQLSPPTESVPDTILPVDSHPVILGIVIVGALRLSLDDEDVSFVEVSSELLRHERAVNGKSASQQGKKSHKECTTHVS